MRLALWLMFISSCIAEAAGIDTQCDQALCWQVAPVVCVADQKSDSCQLDFQLSWQHPEPISLCAEWKGQSFYCWQQQTSGQLQYQLELDGPGELQLQVNGQARLTRQLSVLSRQPSRKRRLVAPWSVF